MPENKEKTKKLVEEELKKQGVEATDEVVEQLAKVAGSDLEGVGGGMSVAGKVALTVGGAMAMAALGAAGMYLGEKAYNKHKGRDNYDGKALNEYTGQLRKGDTEFYNAEHKPLKDGEDPAYYAPAGTGADATDKHVPVPKPF